MRGGRRGWSNQNQYFCIQKALIAYHCNWQPFFQYFQTSVNYWWGSTFNKRGIHSGKAAYLNTKKMQNKKKGQKLL